MKTSHFASGECGTVLVEAALVIPVLLVLFIGMIEFSEAYAVKRKAASVATATADLVAQSSSVTTAGLTDISLIATNLLQPYPTSPLSLTITSVMLDGNGNSVVDWSYPVAQGSPNRCDAFPLPPGLIGPKESVIVAQTAYVYTPVVAEFLTSGRTFTSSAYFKPRLGAFVVQSAQQNYDCAQISPH